MLNFRNSAIAIASMIFVAGCASSQGSRTGSVTRPMATKVTTHVVTHDAKLIGTAVGGVRVIIRDAATNRILAEGVHLGGTGDTKRIMQDPRSRNDTIYTAQGGARYDASISISTPTLVDISAEGPLDYPDQMARSSKRLMLLPGQDVGGDGVVLELHGFIIDLMSPDTTQALPSSSSLKVRAKVRMLCSCPTEPGGMWEVKDLVARLIRDSTVVRETKLTYSGQPSEYTGELGKVDAGVYRLEVLAASASSSTFGFVGRRITIAK